MATNRLILIRQFFDEAIRVSAAETRFVRMRAILNLDACVELSLNAILYDHGSSDHQTSHGARKNLSWHKLWELADSVVQQKLGKSLPNRAQLKTLRENRNLTQHRGTIPSIDTVREAVEPTRHLLDFVCRELYDLEFERLKEWDALECKALRRWLSDCSEAIDRGAPFVAAVACKLAYNRLVRCVLAASTAGVTRLPPGVRIPAELVPLFRQMAEQLQETCLAIESNIVAVSLGLPIADHFKFQRVAQGVVATEVLDGKEGFHCGQVATWRSDDERSVEDARFMVDYLGRTSVLLESAYPGVFESLRLPGGRLSESSLWQSVPCPHGGGAGSPRNSSNEARS